MIPKEIAPPTARFVAEQPICFWADDYTASAGVPTPEIDATEERLVLAASKPTWEPETQLFKELHGIDIGNSFESAADDRPHHAQRLDSGLARLRVHQLWFLLALGGRPPASDYLSLR